MSAINIPQTVIKDESINNSFLKYGFTLLGGVLKSQMAELNDKLKDYLTIEEGHFNYSLMKLSHKDNLALHRLIVQSLSHFLNSHFTNYKVLSASLLVKPLQFNEEMDLHQDWSFTNEKEFCPITLWIPLQDVDVKNGSLFFLPQSHRAQNNYRSYDYQTARFNKNLFKASIIESVNTKSGDVILFHPAVFHGSNKNQSNQHRIVISATLLPQNAPYIFVKKKDEETASIQYLHEESFFTDLKKLDQNSSFLGKSSEDVKYKHDIIDVKELINLLKLN